MVDRGDRRARGWVALALALSACGGAAGTAVKTRPGVEAGTMRVGDGPMVAVVGDAGGLEREPVHLALYIDGGSRQAAQAELAVLTARFVALRVGSNARGRAFSDGIEIIAPCPDGLARCVQRLARGFELGLPSQPGAARATPASLGAPAVAAMRRDVEAARRAARALDAGLRADELGLRALWPQVAGLLPNERARGEVNPAAVRGFASAVLAPQRALIVASGPVTVRDLAAQTRTAFERIARARKQSSAASGLPKTPLPAPREGVQVEVDDRLALSFSLTAPNARLARLAAYELRERLLRERGVVEVRGDALELHGAAVAVLRVSLTSDAVRDDMAALIRRASFEVARMREEGVSLHEPSPATADALAAMRALGTRFTAHATLTADANDAARLRLGVGALIAGGRADRPSASDPDVGVREQARAQLARAFEAGAALVLPAVRGEQSERAASVTLDNGARIAVSTSSGEAVSVAVLLGVGAGSDPPAQHGRAALLAMLMTTACAGRAPDELALELRDKGMTLRPSVSESALGIVLSAPAANAEHAVSLAAECALSPSLDRLALTRARLRLRQELDAHRARRARAAAVIAPRTPGALAPWGNPDTLPSVDERALRELIAAARRAPKLSLAAMGALRVATSVERAARRLAWLPREPASDTAKAPLVGALTSTTMATTALPPRAVEALWIWTTSGCSIAPSSVHARGQLETAARGFASSAALELVKSAGGAHSVPWLDGGCDAGLLWAAMLVRAPADALARSAAAHARLGASLDLERLGAATANVRSSVLATPLDGRAEALAEHALDPAPRPVPAARALLERLRATPPVIMGSPP